MNTALAMYAVSCALSDMHDAQSRNDGAGALAAKIKADRIMLEYARDRMARVEPASLARSIINAAGGRAMGQPPTRGPRSSEPGASSEPEKDQNGRKSPKTGKKRARGRPAGSK